MRDAEVIVSVVAVQALMWKLMWSHMDREDVVVEV